MVRCKFRNVSGVEGAAEFGDYHVNVVKRMPISRAAAERCLAE